MPADKPINTTIANLPALAATEFAGERPINEEHIDNNVELINTFLEKLVNSIYSAGGKVSGTLTDASPVFTLAGFLGVTSDAETIVWCDEAFDLTGLGAGDGDYSLVVTAEGVLGTAFTFDFTDTQGVSETVSHQMNASFGKMALRSGSSGAGVQPEDVEVARLTLSGSTWTLSSEITTGPTPRLGSGVYLEQSQNLADLNDVPTARTNLDVYSQAETDSAIDADIATHSADETSVHGITDTAQLMTLNTSQTVSGSKTYTSKIYILEPQPSFWLEETDQTLQGTQIVYQNGSMQFNYRDTGFGSVITSPVIFEMDAPTNSLRIKSSGKVGFGKSSPDEIIDVAGNIKFTGFVGSAGTTLAGFSSTGAINGALYWITNGRKSGEGAAAGTGVWGVWDSATSTLYYQDSVSTAKTAVVA